MPILSRSIDNPHLSEGFPTTVYLRYEHNHPVNCADAVKHREVSEETVAKLAELFESGHSPSSAHDVIQCDSQEEYAANYAHASGDRAICSDLQFPYRYDTLYKYHVNILAMHSVAAVKSV